MPQATFIYGRHAVVAALHSQPQAVQAIWLQQGAHGHALDELRQHAARHQLPLQVVSRQALETKLGQVVHQGVAAQLAPFQYCTWEQLLANVQPLSAALLLALDQVQSPHNVGAIIRSAYAFGAHGLLIPKDRSCDITASVIKASAGTALQLPICRITNLRRSLQQLQQHGFWVVGTASQASDTLSQLDCARNLVLVIGSEGQGMRPGTAQMCDFLVSIPMRRGAAGSLNASAAAAVCLYEIQIHREKRK